ncbi:hypothetical protein C0993_010053, partial [Termitomyces sp. T159_Od127]
LEDTLNHGLNLDVFSTLATHLRAMALTLDTLLAHLLSQSSQTLLLHTTLSFSSTLVNTLVDSSATNNIDKSLATLAAQRQDLWLLVTCLHASASLILGLSWFCSTNLRIDW